MKNIIIILLFVFGGYETQAQNCDFTALYRRAMSQIDTGYTFTKSFKLKPSDVGQLDNTIVMTAGKNYHLYVESADTDPHNGVMAILKDETDKIILASNFDDNKKLLKHTISFTCKKTGIYHLILDYSKAKIHCGVAIMSFKKELVLQAKN